MGRASAAVIIVARGPDEAPMLSALMALRLLRRRPGAYWLVPCRWWCYRLALVLHQRLDVSPVGLEAHLKLTLSLRGSTYSRET